MDVYDLWFLLVCIALVALSLGAVVLSREGEWKHLNNCKRTREGMARMIRND